MRRRREILILLLLLVWGDLKGYVCARWAGAAVPPTMPPLAAIPPTAFIGAFQAWGVRVPHWAALPEAGLGARSMLGDVD